MLSDNIAVLENGNLSFAGRDIEELAKKYGTPLFLLDENKIREKCRMYREVFQKCFSQKSKPLYASKANSFQYLYKVLQEEGMGIDVVSCGEIYTAKTAGYDMKEAYFHSNNKTDADISYAIENGIGYFVVDCMEEIEAIEKEAEKRGVLQKVLLRLTPGIDPHTFEAVTTGKVDSKFGSAIETGQAEEITSYTLKQKHLELSGFHCHLGSQIFEEDVFERAVEIMLEFAAQMRRKYGYTAKQLDLGGGYGVRYIEEDPSLDIVQKIEEVSEKIKSVCRELDFPIPQIYMEPGRSIIAEAGMTVYTVGSVKKIPGYKNYVSVDGGMTDNPRFALYKSKYTCLLANKMNEPRDFSCSLVGRCCESGDIIQENIQLPQSVRRGDIVAVCTTGAYNYSMASNYNRLPRPPVVMLRDGEDFVVIERESFEDICRKDVSIERS